MHEPFQIPKNNWLILLIVVYQRAMVGVGDLIHEELMGKATTRKFQIHTSSIINVNALNIALSTATIA